MKPLITCFGEILWDVLPTNKQPGGAPMNVAADLRNFGINAQLISRVGNDELGTELLAFLAQKELPLDLIQLGQTHQTGVANANISDANEVTYKIIQPVAWDYIELDTKLIEAVRQSHFFVYGSLAARSPQTYETLNTLLRVASCNVFDVNLRAPHYDRLTVETLLHQADIVKVNEYELAELTAWYGRRHNLTLEQAMRQLRNQFKLQAICVTLGEDGAALLNESGFFQQASFPIQVADTIGSGDAFLAGFLYKTLLNEPPRKVLEFACATGAYVATKHGATPTFSADTITMMTNLTAASESHG